MANPINRSARNNQPIYTNNQFNTILNNPQAQQIIQTIRRQAPDSHPRDIAHQLAKQKGVDINPLMRRLGLR